MWSPFFDFFDLTHLPNIVSYTSDKLPATFGRRQADLLQCIWKNEIFLPENVVLSITDVTSKKSIAKLRNDAQIRAVSAIGHICKVQFIMKYIKLWVTAKVMSCIFDTYKSIDYLNNSIDSYSRYISLIN